MKTLEERERLAYISGNVELAAVLGEIIDGDSEALCECEHEVNMLKLEIDDLRYELEAIGNA